MRMLLAAPLAAVVVLGVSAPVAAAGHQGHHGHSGDGGYARHAPRPGVTDQNFYFVMGDRFANGDPANDTGGLGGDPLVSGFDPTKKGFYNGGDLDGLRSKLDYIAGARHRRDLADPDLQEQGGPARGRALGRLPRLLDHRLHPGRPAPRHQPGPRGARRRGARPRDEGLLRHHHQPHRRRDRLRARATARRTSRRTSSPTWTPAGDAVRRPRLRRHERVPRRSTPRRRSPTSRSSTPARRTSSPRPGSTT